MDILSRLPVRSLQRFKCVSPSWNALISARYFVMKHLSHSKSDLNSQKLLTIRRPTITKLEFTRYSFSSSSVQVIEDEQSLYWPPNCRPAWIIRCCYDGLVLISTIDTSDQRTNAPHLLLCNPSTRESILLPSRENALSDLVFGLGYDATSDDYKILAADVNGEDSLKEVSVEIFLLKTGSWRKIGKYPTGMHRVSDHLNYGMYSLTFIHGAFHWVGRSAYHTIISFNISNEVYGEIPLLEQMYSMHMYALGHVVYTHNYGVSVLRGCFAIILCLSIMGGHPLLSYGQ
ncbi:F-box/kelch-repeat protein [Capsicum galapagoense]